MAKSDIIVSPGDDFKWSVVFAGTVVALAISIVLMQFGSAIGLSVDAPLRGEGHIGAMGIVATGIWLIWVQVLASFAGGYTAGYLRTPTPEYKAYENELKDGLHGFAVWATSTVFVFTGLAFAAFAAKYVALATDTYAAPADLTAPEQNAAIIFAFSMGATSLLSAVAAWWAATMGGEHRLNGADFGKHLSFKKA